jgi:hypothetical protein
MQPSDINVPTLVDECQSRKPFVQSYGLNQSLSGRRTRTDRTKQNGFPPCKIRKVTYINSCSISRCALLNAPAGSFSKDIDEVEDNRVIVAWYALARFGEENDDRYC